MKVGIDLSPDLVSYLSETGMTPDQIAKCNRTTRMWQDLGYYGDIADWFLADLSKRHGINVSPLDSGKYYPNEFMGRNFITRCLIPFVPFLSDYLRNLGKYESLTLGMIDDAIIYKRLE